MGKTILRGGAFAEAPFHATPACLNARALVREELAVLAARQGRHAEADKLRDDAAVLKRRAFSVATDKS